MMMMTQMVPNGSAAVLRYAIATVFRNENTMNIGPQNRKPVSSTLRTLRIHKNEPVSLIVHTETNVIRKYKETHQFSPPICL